MPVISYNLQKHQDKKLTLTKVSTAPLATSKRVGWPPENACWFIEADVSIRNTIIVIFLLLQLSLHVQISIWGANMIINTTKKDSKCTKLGSFNMICLQHPSANHTKMTRDTTVGFLGKLIKYLIIHNHIIYPRYAVPNP